MTEDQKKIREVYFAGLIKRALQAENPGLESLIKIFNEDLSIFIKEHEDIFKSNT